MPETKPDPAAAPISSAEAMFWSDRSGPAPSPLPEALPTNTRPIDTSPIDTSPIDTNDEYHRAYADSSPPRSGATMIAVGIVAVLFGIGVTTCSHDAAVSAGGGTYVVMYGPIVYGVVSIFRGLLGG